MSAIRVAIVDDHPVFRLGMAALLRSLDGITVVAEAASMQQAVERIDANVDVVLMDLHLGADSGAETTRELLRRAPGLKVLVITMLEDDDAVVGAIRAGARGYLLKGADPDEVERAVRAVANGDVLFGHGIAARALTHLTQPPTRQPQVFPALTDREREVLDLVARGLDNTQISRRLTLSPKTVRNNVSNILTKLQLPDRAAAIVRARENGLGVS